VASNDYQRRKNMLKKEQEKTKWDDGLAHSGYSVDEKPIVYSIPNAISEPLHVSIKIVIIEYVTQVTKGRIYDVLMTLGRGVTLELLVTLWHAIGHSVSVRKPCSPQLC
jgi:hypothetical protein